MENIDIGLKIIQGLFYIIAASVAILTYRSAKRGLLNTVNTEYHKRAFDKIEQLSQELISEFDPDSKNYWAIKNTIKESLKEIHEIYKKNKQQILQLGEFRTGIPDNPDSRRLFILVERIKTDPFIPAKIRDYIVKTSGEPSEDDYFNPP